MSLSEMLRSDDYGTPGILLTLVGPSAEHASVFFHSSQQF